jgi:hypothetical protein
MAGPHVRLFSFCICKWHSRLVFERDVLRPLESSSKALLAMTKGLACRNRCDERHETVIVALAEDGSAA